jgi:hypothetical protein
MTVYIDNEPIPGTEKKDAINPNHYRLSRSGQQPHHVVEDFNLTYNVGTSLVYLLRAGKKEISTYEEDIRKAMRHLEFELESVKKNK